MKLPSTKHAFVLSAVLAALPGIAIAGGGKLQVRDLAAATGTAGDDMHAGWITLSRDDEAMRALAAELGIELRPGSDAF